MSKQESLQHEILPVDLETDKQTILNWCDTIEKCWKPREDIPRRLNPTMMPEQVLATAVRYIRMLCGRDQVNNEAECNVCSEGIMQHTSFMGEDGITVINAYGCNRCTNVSTRHML